VATDVAARGIDIPSLSLVIHVEVPRDAEVLQHRSGRTGRAGRKGTAVIVVPYPRRRRVEMMLRSAQVSAEWVPVPTAEAIRAQDNERLLEELLKPIEPTEADEALAAALLERRSPQDLALALVMAYRAKMPEPEDVGEQDEPRGPVRREGFDEVQWFRMDIGRRHNADPRWLLPLLCRRGHVTRGEIGAIRIGQNETYFQIPTAAAGKFAAAVKRTADPTAEDERGITIEASAEAPRDVAKGRRRDNAGAAHGGPPRVHRKGPPRGHAPRR
jgi:ATP-dependent RNA helicase DeaD